MSGTQVGNKKALSNVAQFNIFLKKGGSKETVEPTLLYWKKQPTKPSGLLFELIPS